MTILVTGGAGFIGSHLVEHLLEAGNRVICLDNFDSFYSPMVKRANIKDALLHPSFTLIEGDIRDAGGLKQCFEENEIDVVVHLAARAGVRPSIQNPELYYDVNVMGTLRLLEAMRTHGVTKLVFASSSSVYGNNKKVPFDENDTVDTPISPYTATKKACELLCHTYHHLYAFDVFALRFFTVYGPRQRPEMAISHFTRSILQGKPIELFGDGTTSRDYTFVGDIVSGLEAAISHVNGYEIINLGNSHPVPLIELVHVIEEVAGKKATIRWSPMQAGDVQTTWADTAKAKRLLGYSPSTPIRDGLAAYVQWLREKRQ